jgi:hypothetical protein
VRKTATRGITIDARANVSAASAKAFRVQEAAYRLRYATIRARNGPFRVGEATDRRRDAAIRARNAAFRLPNVVSGARIGAFRRRDEAFRSRNAVFRTPDAASEAGDDAAAAPKLVA